MNPERHAGMLIKNVQPYLNHGKYVFVSLKEENTLPFNSILYFFREAEGVSCVLEKQIADKMHLSYSFVAGWITLNVYSSLEAVGLTARVAEVLASKNISCNAVAAYNHDHIFVPFKHVDEAMSLLRKL